MALHRTKPKGVPSVKVREHSGAKHRLLSSYQVAALQLEEAASHIGSGLDFGTYKTLRATQVASGTRLQANIRVTAGIVYPVVKELDNGFYCWVDLDEDSILKFSALRKVVPASGGFKYDNATELHATVFYHSQALPPDQEMPKDKPMSAKVLRVEAWTDHKDRKLLVAILDSPDLVAVHQELERKGFVHNFETYDPHITLGCYKGIALEEAEPLAQEMAKRMTSLIQEVDFDLQFCPCLYADSLV